MNSLEVNKYKKWYDNIIKYRKNNKPFGYSEKHHIIPRSLGGLDIEDNLVLLTTKEHFIVHALLVKMYVKDTYEWYKMNHAFMMMKCTSFTNNKRYFNSRLYASLRGNFSDVMSKAQSGKNNSGYGTVWISNIKIKKTRKISKRDIIPEGWVKGRNAWNRKIKYSLHKISCKYCQKDFIQKTAKSKFCSSICENRWYYENAKTIIIEKNGTRKEIRHNDLFSYKEYGWKIIQS